MFWIDRLILIGGVLLLVAILSTRLSSRVNMPVLVLFLGVGMLAGSEGIGGIEFESYALAHAVGTLALGVILFDGGLRTPRAAFRAAVAPSLVLATAGVLITALLAGAIAWVLFDLTYLEGLLLGAIVGSTDAAAVFAVLRSRGLHLPERLSSTLEIESGSNDPMAIFLTIAVLQILLGRLELGPAVLGLFALQMSAGAAAGLLIGWGTARLLARVDLEAAGLYPVLTAAAGLVAYGGAAAVGGSGFLSVYLAGIVIGNSRVVFRRGILLFHDGMAWLAQAVMFILLGLLSFPSRLLAVGDRALLVALGLMFVARPVAVAGLLAPFRYRAREILFLSWGGLRGAVPIVLATYPLLLGHPRGDVLFDIVFFVVLVSAVTQGWSLPPLARRLGLHQEAAPEPPVTLEITSLKHVDGDIVEYAVVPEARAAGRLVRDLALPEGAVVALVLRGETLIPPRGSTRVLPGDYVFLVVRPAVRPLVDRVFAAGHPDEPVPTLVEFPLRGHTTAADLEEFYGIVLDVSPHTVLADLLAERLGPKLAPGRSISVGPARLYAREIVDGRVEEVGLALLPEEERRASPAEEAPGAPEGNRPPGDPP